MIGKAGERMREERERTTVVVLFDPVLFFLKHYLPAESNRAATLMKKKPTAIVEKPRGPSKAMTKQPIKQTLETMIPRL